VQHAARRLADTDVIGLFLSGIMCESLVHKLRP